MDVYVKAKLDHSQLNAKESIGCDGIELQLLGELAKVSYSKYSDTTELINLQDFSQYKVKVVHAPLYRGGGSLDCELEMLTENNASALKHCFQVANYFGEIQDTDVTLVVHSMEHFKYLKDTCRWGRVVQAVNECLQEFSRVTLAIENASPIRSIENGVPIFSNNVYSSSIEMAKELRCILKTDRVGTVLDVCHALLTDKYVTAIHNAMADLEYSQPDTSLARYYEMSKETLKLVHLARYTGSGYGKGRHGIAFTDDSYAMLRRILATHLHYAPECPITIEVEENNYLKCDGYRNTKKLLEEALDELGHSTI
ncbi:TIM barrel protein [Acetivibrio ethanolgignens]|uniref:Xylose isomerase-like TIM barrel domain-containing protein n=1 Tax=Acetivibrio ethanolgignens TaxID=290052 RepID=A0A0V8QEU8_9FIRM|nr:TIM barrel protein [Acetivibrio ethanolgignens]KSV58758.1 hypothetical protein ASU35_11890 [Acetivibrio ethanolgignens]